MTDISAFPESLRSTLLLKEFTLKELGFDGDEINLTRFKWSGDYDTGKLIDIVSENKSIVTEKDIDEKYHSMFWSRYDLTTVLYTLILNTPMKYANGITIQNFLEKILKRKEDDKKFFSESPLHIWESIEETKKREKDAFK
jgi:hypothetical protein